MVKVVDRSPEDIAREERLSKLAQIARDLLPSTRVHAWGGYYIDIHFDESGKRRVGVNLSKENIDVEGSEYFDSAMKLAEHYERVGEPEFTVKRNYSTS